MLVLRLAMDGYWVVDNANVLRVGGEDAVDVRDHLEQFGLRWLG